MQKLLLLLGFMLLVQPDTPNQYGGTLRIGCTMEVQTLDPHRINVDYEDFDSTIQVVNQVFEGLVCYKSGTADIEPLLAESWDISEDGLVYTFHLRKDVYWQDGNDLFPEGRSRPVKAKDIAYSWDRATAPETLSPMRDFYADIAKIKSWQPKGSYTFEVTLKQVNPSFLYMLPFPCFLVVPEEMRRYNLEEFSSHAVGSGPFEVETRNPVVLHYNEDYWKGEPYVTEIQYTVVNPENLISEFEKKTIDWCLIPHEYWDEFSSYPVVTVPRFEILYMGINCQKTPFTDVRVRKAINYALDPGAVLDQIYKGKAVEATSILPPGLVCHTHRDNVYARNVEKAVQLLEEAGYTGNPRLTLELKSSESYIQQQFNQVYINQLKEVGVDLTVTYLDLGSLLHAIDTGDTQMFTLGWDIGWPYPDQFLFLFHSSNWGSGGNGCFYTNKTVDDLLEKAARETDTGEACSLFKKAEDIIIDDAAWVLQWRRVDGYAVQEWINGFNPGGMGDKYEKMDTIWISADRRQTIRIPHNAGKKEEIPLMYVGVIIGGLVVVVVLVRLAKAKAKTKTTVKKPKR